MTEKNLHDIIIPSWQPETKIENYLISELNLEIYRFVNEKPLEERLRYLNDLYFSFELIKENINTPSALMKYLMKDLSNNEESYRFLSYLYLLVIDSKDYKNYQKNPKWNLFLELLNEEIFQIGNFLFPDIFGSNVERNRRGSSFTIKPSYGPKERLSALFNWKNEYSLGFYGKLLHLQGNGKLLEILEFEIRKLNKFFATLDDEPTQSQLFQLSNKDGAKTNLIRILNALHGLNYIERTDGQFPTKKEFMETFGHFLGVDLSTYDVILSKAINSQTPKSNTAVFDEMKKIMEEKFK